MAKAILLDIEGTVVPLDFVHNTLIPYAKARVPGYVLDNLGSLKFEVERLAEEHARDDEYPSEFRPESPNSVSDYLKFLIDRDRKSTPLKSIEGMIWHVGYESGEIVSPVFADVPGALKRWKTADKSVSIFSSGSVLAQQLLFRHTDQGDLTQFISDYFDTATGPKNATESYSKIAEKLNELTADVLFVSDSVAELDAARSIGMQTSLSVRPGNPELTEDCVHKIVTTFDGLE